VLTPWPSTIHRGRVPISNMDRLSPGSRLISPGSDLSPVRFPPCWSRLPFAFFFRYLFSSDIFLSYLSFCATTTMCH
jgi:hypothetical protein